MSIWGGRPTSDRGAIHDFELAHGLILGDDVAPRPSCMACTRFGEDDTASTDLNTGTVLARSNNPFHLPRLLALDNCQLHVFDFDAYLRQSQNVRHVCGWIRGHEQ